MLPPMSAMRTPRHISRLVLACAILFALATAVGCEDEIGDSCDFNVDCSPRGDRLCDLSSPGGYCTIENCNAESCPDEAVCIAFYPVAFLNVPCNPGTEDCNPSADDEGCAAEADRTDHCSPDEICTMSGFCAPEASARRWCMRKCGGSGDCRSGYECRHTGLEGAERVPPLDEPRSDKTARFCAPKP